MFEILEQPRRSIIILRTNGIKYSISIEYPGKFFHNFKQKRAELHNGIRSNIVFNENGQGCTVIMTIKNDSIKFLMIDYMGIQGFEIEISINERTRSYIEQFFDEIEERFCQ